MHRYFSQKSVAKVVLFLMPKQVKEKAKMWYFAFLEAARFARSEQAGNPRFRCLSAREIFGLFNLLIHNSRNNRYPS